MSIVFENEAFETIRTFLAIGLHVAENKTLAHNYMNNMTVNFIYYTKTFLKDVHLHVSEKKQTDRLI